MRKLAVLAALCLVAVARPSSAENPTDGTHLLAGCQLALAGFDRPGDNVTPADALRTGVCIGFLDGVVGAHRFDTLRSAESGRLLPRAFCIPDRVTTPEQARALLAFLNAHPERLKETGVSLVYAAFAEAWPCPADIGK
jgi:hypothetical protein